MFINFQVINTLVSFCTLIGRRLVKFDVLTCDMETTSTNLQKRWPLNKHMCCVKAYAHYVMQRTELNNKTFINANQNASFTLDIINKVEVVKGKLKAMGRGPILNQTQRHYKKVSHHKPTVIHTQTPPEGTHNSKTRALFNKDKIL